MQCFSLVERLILVGLIAIAIGGSVAANQAANRNALFQPVGGGVHIEGLVGSPTYINPVLADTNQADLDLIELIYSGLTKLSPGRDIEPDLATSWEVFDNGKTYVFHLREDVFWHDGQPFTAQDAIYTINVLQNENYQGVLKSSFAGVGVEAVNDYTVKFTLPEASAFFLANLSVGIIPQHIYQDIPVYEFKVRYTEDQIIGTGPYRYEKSTDGESVSLKRFKDYYATAPFIDRLVFFFYDSEKSLAAAYKNRVVSAAGFETLSDADLELTPLDAKYVYALPQYKAIFFNQLGANNAIKSQTVRQALAYATNKQQIVEEVEAGWADVVDSPILPGFWGHNPDAKKYEFSITEAAAVLKNGGWVDVDKDGFLEKDGTRLSFTISVRDDASSLRTAEILRDAWTAIGVEVGIHALDTATLIKDVIRPRNYEVLIFGQDLGADSDPYAYWHSSQIEDPGLALAVEFDKDIDNNLESARLSTSLNKTITYYHRFQNAFADIVPAILLYQPRYMYLVDAKVNNVTEHINLSSTSDRFLNIAEWYIKTKKE